MLQRLKGGIVALVALSVLGCDSGSSQADQGAPSAGAAVPAEKDAAFNSSQTTLLKLAEMYPGSRLPHANVVSQGQITALTTGIVDQNNFRILYYQNNRPIPLDDARLKERLPVASFMKKTFASEALAKNYIRVSAPGGLPVDLGHGVTGFQQGAAGSAFINWCTGNWRFTIQVSNILGEDAIGPAKAVVDYLQNASLPVPDDLGQVLLRPSKKNYEQNVYRWREGNVVYELTHQNYLQGLAMTASVR